jgi:hypothetical protein
MQNKYGFLMVEDLMENRKKVLINIDNIVLIEPTDDGVLNRIYLNNDSYRVDIDRNDYNKLMNIIKGEQYDQG